jgi:ATP-dependent Clp protease ATP-binding subunit ClpC
MFEHFTDRSRKVMALANQEAVHHGHPSIDTEHMLLGLVKEGAGIGANVLKPLVGGDLLKVRREVEKMMASDGPRIKQSKLPQTNAAKAVIMFAIQEAQSLNHGYVGTEHFLLGMMRQAEGVAGRALANLGLRIDVVRTAIVEFLGQGSETPDAGAPEFNEAMAPIAVPPKPKPWWRFW